MQLKWLLATGALAACLGAQGALAQTCGVAPPGAFSIFANSSGSPLTQSDGVYAPGAYVELDACLNYAPAGGQGKFYTGSVTNVFLDRQGRYIASNGQALVDSVGMALPTFAPHAFGAGTETGYSLAGSNVVATQVLVQASIIDCPSRTISSCVGTPKPYLWLFQTGATPTRLSDADEGGHNCGHPPRADDGPRVSVHGDPDPDDGQFRLFAEGLLRVADNPGGATTEVSIQSCLRLVPDDAKMARGYYAGQAIAYFFGPNGLVLGSGTQNLGVGGQQLNVLEIPRPTIVANDPRLIDDQAGIHDVGIGVAVPLVNHADVDSHVLLAVSLWPCANDLSSCNGARKTYYRVVDACAPDLPNFDKSRCPGIKP